jgi:IclR family pca regulon transcriptional regulator
VIYLIRLRNTDLVTANLQVGSRLPAVSTSMGKALLAGRDVAELRRILTKESFEFRGGKNAIRSIPALVPELSKIARRGYALQDEEVADGLRSIAVPITNRRGVTVAAVNVAVSATRHAVTDLVREYLDPLRAVAASIGRQLDDRTI